MRWFEIVLIILIVLFLGGILAWQIVKRVRAHKGKSTKTSCGCGDCSACSACSGCNNKQQEKYYGNDTDDVMPEINVQSEVTCDFSDLI